MIVAQAGKVLSALFFRNGVRGMKAGRLAMVLEPKMQISEERRIFSNRDLKELILPLFIEQLLAMLVGIADTLMVSYAGEAAVSGVSLVNMFNTIFIYLFTALAAGGAVVVSQYIGSGDKKNSNLAASQLYTFSFLFSIVSMVLVLLGNRWLLHLLFGSTEADVMAASVVYLRISAYSYPALALYNAGAALYRSMSRTQTTMKVSLGMNAINVAGNAIGIFVLHAGVAGVAWPSTISRIFAAVVMTALCFSRKNQAFITWKQVFAWNGSMVKRLLGVAVPNGIENGLFQLAKVALSSIIALFGTSQIAANGVAQSIWSLAALVGAALGPAFITVVGQCMGAGDVEAADYYMKKLFRLTMVISVVWNFLILAVTPLVLLCYDLSPETKELVFLLVVIHNLFNAFVFPVGGPFANGLRAAGDVKYTMYCSLFATIVCRVALSVVFGIWLNMGVIGVALAMACDWCIKAVLLGLRYRSGKWKSFQLLA